MEKGRRFADPVILSVHLEPVILMRFGVHLQSIQMCSPRPRHSTAILERHRTKANVETLWKISEALGMKISDLMRMVEQTIEREG